MTSQNSVDFHRTFLIISLSQFTVFCRDLTTV